jgi:hypothetical protein
MSDVERRLECLFDRAPRRRLLAKPGSSSSISDRFLSLGRTSRDTTRVPVDRLQRRRRMNTRPRLPNATSARETAPAALAPCASALPVDHQGTLALIARFLYCSSARNNSSASDTRMLCAPFLPSYLPSGSGVKSAHDAARVSDSACRWVRVGAAFVPKTHVLPTLPRPAEVAHNDGVDCLAAAHPHG